MTLHAAAIKCSLSQEARAERLELRSDNSWHRLTDHWLPDKEGKWSQQSNSGVLVTGDDHRKLLFLTGFQFAGAFDGYHGRLLGEFNGDAGTWSVVTTTQTPSGD
ncbi:hypothetical protein LMG27952_06718 [Paraburkholderia hiiakae]|uniref:Uncharacterized protein n=1 Tax=Paraburkholderia hiiakae TaxID=1081782 RepID=A0ABM8P829_9BURK|nr:hypothetical protein [Paraburkholderia hiiakae]CAD6558811.1 hypothetical protein LMG27952_06718 [Paraburkholderia hiiakae]